MLGVVIVLREQNSLCLSALRYGKFSEVVPDAVKTKF